jgi:hypothetical protein
MTPGIQPKIVKQMLMMKSAPHPVLRKTAMGGMKIAIMYSITVAFGYIVRIVIEQDDSKLLSNLHCLRLPLCMLGLRSIEFEVKDIWM